MSDKALIFRNLINGVPVAQVAQTFQVSEAQALQTFAFVLRKIKSYQFKRHQPLILASNIEEARKYQVTCLSVLAKLNLEKDDAFKDIHSEIMTPDNALSIARNL